MKQTATAPETPASRIMGLVRGLGPTKREELVRRTGLSPATVARAASGLVDSGLLRYGRDRGPARGAGRPGLPLEVDTRRFAVIGIHLGRRAVTVALGDLSGRVLETRVRPHPNLDLATVAEVVAEVVAAQGDRRPLAAGVVAPWQELGWDRAAITNQVHDKLGLDLDSAEHLTAMAQAEFLHQRTATGTMVFLYARDTAGFVVVDHDGERLVVSQPWRLDHFPTGSAVDCHCGRTGCLIATCGDQAIARSAYAEGWVPQPRMDLVFRAATGGHAGIRGLLADRARTLATLVGDITQMGEPDRVVLAGQAFTADPAILQAAAATTSAEVTATRYGSEIQAYAACATALQRVDRDPFGLAPRVSRARGRPGSPVQH